MSDGAEQGSNGAVIVKSEMGESDEFAHLPNFKFSDIVQFPVILKGDAIATPIGIDLNKLNEMQIKELAKIIDGELAWIKVRAVYLEMGQKESLCMWRNCYRVSRGKRFCTDHVDK